MSNEILNGFMIDMVYILIDKQSNKVIEEIKSSGKTALTIPKNNDLPS